MGTTATHSAGELRLKISPEVASAMTPRGMMRCAESNMFNPRVYATPQGARPLPTALRSGTRGGEPSGGSLVLVRGMRAPRVRLLRPVPTSLATEERGGQGAAVAAPDLERDTHASRRYLSLPCVRQVQAPIEVPSESHPLHSVRRADATIRHDVAAVRRDAGIPRGRVRNLPNGDARRPMGRMARRSRPPVLPRRESMRRVRQRAAVQQLQHGTRVLPR